MVATTDYEDEFVDIVGADKPGNITIDHIYGAEEYQDNDPPGNSILAGEVGRTEVGLMGHKKNLSVGLGVVGFHPGGTMESGYQVIKEAQGAVEKWQYYGGMGGTNALNEINSADADELNDTDVIAVVQGASLIATLPSWWTTGSGTWSVDEEDDYRVMKVTAGGGTTGEGAMYFTPATPVANIDISFAVKLTTTSPKLGIYGYETDTLWKIGFGNDTAGKIEYYTGGAWVNVCDFAADTWYKIRIVVNDAANTFDLYVDGTLEGDDLAYSTNSTTGTTWYEMQYPSTGTAGTLYVAWPVSDDFATYDTEKAYISFDVEAPIYEDATVTAATLTITVDDLWEDGNVTIHGIASGLDSSISLADIAAMTFTTASVAAELEEGSNEINVLTIIQELVAAGDYGSYQGFRISPTTAQAIAIDSAPSLSLTVTQPDNILCTSPSAPVLNADGAWESTITVNMIYRNQDKET